MRFALDQAGLKHGIYQALIILILHLVVDLVYGIWVTMILREIGSILFRVIIWIGLFLSASAMILGWEFVNINPEKLSMLSLAHVIWLGAIYLSLFLPGSKQ